MTHTGILVPADPAQEHRLVIWGDHDDPNLGLLAMLDRELGRDDAFDAATVVPGLVRLWCRDRTLLATEPDYNDRAIALCRALGCHEWCYPSAPCKGCELPSLRAHHDALIAAAGVVVRALDDQGRLHALTGGPELAALLRTKKG